MLTKIGVAALLGTIGTAVVGAGTAQADEHCDDIAQVTVDAPFARTAWTDDEYGSYGRPGVYYRRGYREELERIRHERREAAFRRAMWLHRHGRYGYWR